MSKFPTRVFRSALACSALIALSACDGGLDLDIRDKFGDSFDTSGAVRQASAPRPNPDNRGVISYPGYQVAVARRGDTIRTVADRIGVDATTIGRYNAIAPDTPLPDGEIIALPERVAEPSPSTGAIGTGPIRPAGAIDVQSIAGDAIDRSSADVTTTPMPQTGEEPVRHKVARGETAYSIARLHGVSVKALADWNGLGSDLVVREGQFLLIPVADQNAPARADDVSRPGDGSPTPTPPSATQPLPDDDTVSAEPLQAPAAPAIAEEARDDTSKLLFPVDGNIIRPYEAGGNGGIDIAASSGSPVRAAKEGTVAAITQDTENVPVLVIRHAGNLLTVYANIGNISVKKGDRVQRGQQIARVRNSDPSFVRFEVRQGFDAVDPMPMLN